jgi:hypothetical protein
MKTVKDFIPPRDQSESKLHAEAFFPKLRRGDRTPGKDSRLTPESTRNRQQMKPVEASFVRRFTLPRWMDLRSANRVRGPDLANPLS